MYRAYSQAGAITTRLMIVIAVLVGLLAFHGGISGRISDNGQKSTHVEIMRAN
jgi:hypothetical protein